MISRRRRTEALVESDPSVAHDLAALVERAVGVREVAPPRQGLVMCQVRETARNSRFYLGEALMTECRVRIGDAEVICTNKTLITEEVIRRAPIALLVEMLEANKNKEE